MNKTNDIVENKFCLWERSKKVFPFFSSLYFLICVMEKIQYILDLAKTLDNNPSLDIDNQYTKLVNLPITIDSDFFELVYFYQFLNLKI